MEIHLNDETREVPDNVSLQQLIANLNLAPERIAIEVNHNVIRRSHWPSTVLKEGDRVEIVHFVGGGAPGGRSRDAGGRGRWRRSQGDIAPSCVQPPGFCLLPRASCLPPSAHRFSLATFRCKVITHLNNEKDP